MARRRDDDDDDYDDEDDDDDYDDRPRGKKGGKKGGKRGGGPPIGDYLFFRKLIGAPLATISFFLGLIVCLYLAIYNFYLMTLDPMQMARWDDAAVEAIADHGALFYLFVGPCIVRGLCEVLAFLPRLADSLDALQKSAEEKKGGRDDDDDDDYED